MSIGQRIKERRLDLKMSQRDLASKLGYSDHTTLARIEGDKVNLSEPRIKQISNVLGVSIGHLMGWEENPEETGLYAASVLKDMDLQQLLQNYLSLDKDDQERIRGLIKSLATKRNQPESR